MPPIYVLVDAIPEPGSNKEDRTGVYDSIFEA